MHSHLSALCKRLTRSTCPSGRSTMLIMTITTMIAVMMITRTLAGTIAKTMTTTDLVKTIMTAPASAPTTTIPNSHHTTTTTMMIMAVTVMAVGGSALWTMPLHCVYIYIIYV